MRFVLIEIFVIAAAAGTAPITQAASDTLAKSKDARMFRLSTALLTIKNCI